MTAHARALSPPECNEDHSGPTHLVQFTTQRMSSPMRRAFRWLNLLHGSGVQNIDLPRLSRFLGMRNLIARLPAFGRIT